MMDFMRGLLVNMLVHAKETQVSWLLY